ncbi:MAG: hypothetical protein H0W13_06270 [Nitrospirales bacterium]|nr:hypothetical protein [Nitrospirales bacterium]
MSNHHISKSALVMMCCLATACTTPEIIKRHHGTAASASDTFTVLTYNTLHGLEVGRFWVWPGESRAERTGRFNITLHHLTDTQPDIMLLQEVNPLPHMAEEYVRALHRLGLSYTEVHQVDACSLDVLDLGLVPGLNNGLVILAKEPLRIRKLAGVKLSGGIGGCGDHWGIQFGELRYAVIAESRILSPTCPISSRRRICIPALSGMLMCFIH